MNAHSVSFATRAGPVSALLAACAVGPDYAPPRVETSDAFLHTDDTRVASTQIETQWWTQLAEPTLDRLIEQAFAANPDIAIARANLRASRALLTQGRLEQFPIVTASADATRQRQSEQAVPIATPPGAEEFYEAGLDALWELDFFGRVRRSVQALTGEYQAQEATLRDALVSVAAEVARSYLELRGLQYRLSVAEDNVENQEQTYELTQALLAGGRGTQLDVVRAQAQLEITRASIPPIEADVAAAIHRLAVLVGQTPGELYAPLIKRQPLPALPKLVGVDRPAELLRRRPDVRAAERQLAAATARIGVAVADLFPRVSVVSSAGYLATDLDELGRASTERYSVGPTISWAAFDLGRVRARVLEADARADAQFAQYQRTVLAALEETETALARYSRSLVAQERLKIAAQASDQAAELARLRYRYGADPFLTVLDAERRQLEAQDQLAQATTDTALALVALYKALGGGWEGIALQ